MSIFTLGAIGCLSYASYVAWNKYGNAESRKFKQVVAASWYNYKMFVTHGEGKDKRYENVKILKVEKRDYGWWVKIVLPSGLPLSKFKNCLEGLEQDTYSKIKLKQIYGSRVCTLAFGRIQLREKGMKFREELINKDRPLAIPFYTPFGVIHLDFADDSSCHALGGGATRMGKTSLFRLIILLLLLQTEGKIQILAIDTKISDLHMFKNIPQVSLVEDTRTALRKIVLIKKEYLDRKKKLAATDCVDIASYRKQYPNDPLPPVFVFVDEYGIFADRDDPYCEEFQKVIKELAERAGYVDIHLVIAAQRPDARDVLQPRIKNNLLVRIAFTTTDEANSEIILDVKGAENLGGIKGRALLKDGLLEEVQVPHVTVEQSIKLLNEAGLYKKYIDPDKDVVDVQNAKWVDDEVLLIEGETTNDSIPNHDPSRKFTQNDSERKGRKNNKRSKEVQSDDKGSDWDAGMPE